MTSIESQWFKHFISKWHIENWSKLNNEIDLKWHIKNWLLQRQETWPEKIVTIPLRCLHHLINSCRPNYNYYVHYSKMCKNLNSRIPQNAYFEDIIDIGLRVIKRSKNLILHWLTYYDWFLKKFSISYNYKFTILNVTNACYTT